MILDKENKKTKCCLNAFFYKAFLVAGLIGLVFTSCTNQSRMEYVISKEDSLNKIAHTRADGIVLLPPDVKFARYNFIIDTSNNLYFYSFPEPKQTAGTFDGEEDQIGGLQPNNLFRIPKGLESSFFEENVVLQKTSEKVKTINVASFKDTVRNDLIKILKNVLIKDSSGYLLKIRRVLPEEKEVLKSKIEGKHYIPIF
jgi:hypothetical protein